MVRPACAAWSDLWTPRHIGSRRLSHGKRDGELRGETRIPLEQRQVGPQRLPLRAPRHLREQERRERLSLDPLTCGLLQRGSDVELDLRGGDRLLLVRWKGEDDPTLLQRLEPGARDRRRAGRILHPVLERETGAPAVERGQLVG